MIRSPCSRRLVSIACLAAYWFAPTSFALDAPIAAQPLSTALREFAQKSGLQLIYVSQLAEARRTAGAPAGLSDTQTLTRLLRGSGLRHEFVNEYTVQIYTGRGRTRTRAAGAKVAVAQAIPETLEEVLVTAERRLADSQKTSISISTLDGALLQRESRTDLRAALLPLPGVIMQGDVGRYNVSIRGIGTNTPPNAAETTVALNSEGIYNDMQISTAANYFDINRVEVLRGPQGTLYGRNAAAGVVNIISNDPLPVFEANGLFETGNYRLQHFDGVLNVPVADTLSTRLAVNWLKHDGYLSNGQNDQDASAARIKLLYDPNEKLHWLLGALFEREEGSNGTVPVFKSQPDDAWIDNDDTPNSSVSSSQLVYSRVDWDLGLGTLRIVPSYQYRTTRNDFHSSGNRRNETNNWLAQKSLELRFTSPVQSSLNWVTGLYVYDSDGVLYLSSGRSDYSVQSTAVFGQLTLPLSKRLRGIAGLRKTFDNKSRSRADLSFSGDWQNLDFKVGAEFDVAPQSMLYLTAATGYRPGGVYEQPPGNFRIYEPEHLLSYELGTKNQFLENRLQLNADVFMYDYRDFQATGIRYVNGVPLSGYQNAPGAWVSGAEVESRWIPWQMNRLELSVAYLRARFKQGFINNFIDYSGSTLENSPRFSSTLRYEREWNLAGGVLVASGEVIAKSHYYLAYSGVENAKQPAYAMANLALNYTFPGERFSASAWVHNVTDYALRSAYITTPNAGDYLSIGPPRTYGVGISAQF
ncbi:MAG: TonB-dependent receptor [Steroidobacteraceae bacterium]